MFIDAAAALPSSVMKSRRFQLIKQHSLSAGRAGLQNIEMAGISQREPEPLHNPCSLTYAQSPFGSFSEVEARPALVHYYLNNGRRAPEPATSKKFQKLT